MHRSPSSLLSIASIVASMTSVAVGNGMMLAYVPFVLTRSAAPDWVPGAAVTAIAFGGLIGCLMGGSLIRRVGHARAFSCSMALVILAALMISLGVHPLLWVVARGLYGIAANMNFIITQSWLNHASENHWRGRAMALFYMAYVIGLGAGAWLFGQIPVEGNLAPIVTIFFTAVAILPIGLTRLPTPPAPARVSIDIPMVWRISPVAFIGVLASGGLSMLVQGFTPIYAAANSVSQKEVAALMFVMQFGLLFIQYPMGALSDRTDRRIVLIATCTLVIAAGIAALAVSFDNLLLLMLVFAMFAGGGRDGLFDRQCACQRSHRSGRFRAARQHHAGRLVGVGDPRADARDLADAGLRPTDLHLCDDDGGAPLRPFRARSPPLARTRPARALRQLRIQKRPGAECRGTRRDGSASGTAGQAPGFIVHEAFISRFAPPDRAAICGP